MSPEAVAIICVILSALTTFIGAGMLWVVTTMRDDIRSLRVEITRRVERVEERINDMTDPNGYRRRFTDKSFPSGK